MTGVTAVFTIGSLSH